MTDKKFPEDLRNFETRLQFLDVIFNNLFSQTDIIAHCIVHKLDRSYLAYVEELQKSMLYLKRDDPLQVLKCIK